MKPYPKTERRVVTVTIDESGDMVYLNTPESDIFMELGERITARASNVLPVRFWYRQAFRILRTLFGDYGRIAQWTREWSTRWYVDTRPVGGPVLTWSDTRGDGTRFDYDAGIATFTNREAAIRAEIKFLNRFFLEGK
jgi:hypothetical protein